MKSPLACWDTGTGRPSPSLCRSKSSRLRINALIRDVSCTFDENGLAWGASIRITDKTGRHILPVVTRR